MAKDDLVNVMKYDPENVPLIEEGPAIFVMGRNGLIHQKAWCRYCGYSKVSPCFNTWIGHRHYCLRGQISIVVWK